jgi:N-acetylglucosamine-6-phosphate deacetylase
MIVLAGGSLVLPGRILSNTALVIDQGRITAIEAKPPSVRDAAVVDVSTLFVVPGFIDVHVHGIEGHDTLDGPGAIAAIAARLPRFGVTAFCPTTVACGPEPLRNVLDQVGRERARRPPGSARVLPAHLESNFISADYAGAQPRGCLCSPDGESTAREFSGRDILAVIESRAADVGIVTLAPELPGALELVAALARAGHRVSIGHSGADFDQTVSAIDAGARHAAHLFNRMTPMTHQSPGVVGAVLSSSDVAAELICDGVHVHPAACRVAIAAKGVDGVMAVTDGTAGSGLSLGATARLGGRVIHVTGRGARLDDGTLAGSTLTMDRAFRNLVTMCGASIPDAAVMCSTSPARALGLTGFGVIAEGATADLAVIDAQFYVMHTYIAGACVYSRAAVA